MSCNRIVNVINFIRAVEPRLYIDLLGTLEREVDLVNRHGFPATWLMQYDALIRPDYVALLRDRLRPDNEVGAWFEIVQPLAEKAGCAWRGRYPWDWHADVGFSIGYTPEERLRLADVFMEDFKAAWGAYPAVIGSWFFDAPLLAHLHARYGVQAACNCRDQHGTDGYTLWGGYWANAYYPSTVNAFTPAQDRSSQIPVPVFRMLGSDPIYQYAAREDDNGQTVVTLEPVHSRCGEWTCGGGDPSWTRWFLNTNFSSPDLAMSYAQTGQENSFGWTAMARGLEDQFALLAGMRDAGTIRLETLGASGRWFKRSFSLTPATAVTALSDWQGRGRQSVWYMSRFQRINWFVDDGVLWLRDWRIFDGRYPERYLDAVCRSHACLYDTPPFIDGYLWGTAASPAGIRLAAGGKGRLDAVEEIADTGLRLAWLAEGGRVVIDVTETSVRLALPGPGRLEFAFDRGALGETSVALANGSRLNYRHAGFDYALHCVQGRFEQDGDTLAVSPDGGIIDLRCR